MTHHFFNTAYKSDLDQAIIDLENRSSVELVVVIKEASSRYRDISLDAGIVLSWIALFVFFFSPPEYGDYLILSATAAAFILGICAFVFVPALKRIFIPKKRRDRQVGLLARAIFQKAGVYKTAQHSGLLVYVSVLERRVVLLPDTAIEKHLPPEDWQLIQTRFEAVFQGSNPAQDLLDSIAYSADIFERDIPFLPDTDSALPNTIHISSDFSI